MAYTAQELIRELGERWGDYALITADAGGTTTTLKTSNFTQWAPQDITKYNPWVYGTSTADATNRAVERRIASWDSANRQFTLHYPGFPEACTTGSYEIHARTRHSRKLAALNSGIRMLSLGWFREVVDQTITTAVNTMSYTLSSGINWGAFPRLQIQVNTDATFTGFPYADASGWNWDVRRSVSSAGVESWVLQFAAQPPPSRILRIFAEVGYGQLALDADILPIAGEWGDRAFEWLMDYSMMQLADWEGNRQPAGQADRYKAMADRLQAKQMAELLRASQVHKNPNIVIPGHGTGDSGGISDSSYLAAFRTLH